MTLQSISTGLLAIAFLGAGVSNAIGTKRTQRDFVRWGYPAWWCRLTGGLEIATAGLVMVAATRTIGIGLGAAIVAAAMLTVLRHRDVSHLVPLIIFAALLLTTAMISVDGS